MENFNRFLAANLFREIEVLDLCIVGGKVHLIVMEVKKGMDLVGTQLRDGTFFRVRGSSLQPGEEVVIDGLQCAAVVEGGKTAGYRQIEMDHSEVIHSR